MIGYVLINQSKDSRSYCGTNEEMDTTRSILFSSSKLVSTTIRTFINIVVHE
jgi:hypothetical protein